MQIDQTTLPTGLTVVSARLPEFESAAIMVVIRAGARDEAAENNGIAHFLEHMAFKGTATRSALDIAVEIECLGAQINAFTSQEMTAYHITGLKDAIPDALAILGDVLTAARYNPDDVAMERNVIAQEIARNNDDPNGLCGEGFIATAYPDQPMGRPILGNPDVVARITREDLIAFVSRHYATGRMVVCAAGDIDHAWLCTLVAQHFANLPTGTGEGTRIPPTYAGGLHRTHRADFKQINVILGFPSVAADTATHLDHKMLSLALGHGMSSPLFQEVREKRGLVYGVGAGSSHGSDSGLFVIQAGMTPENLPEFLRIACAEAMRTTQAIAPNDFTRARNLMLSELASVKERPFQLAMYLASQFFRHGQATGPDIDLIAVRNTPIDALKAAAAIVFAAPPTLSLVGPLDETDHLETVHAALTFL